MSEFECIFCDFSFIILGPRTKALFDSLVGKKLRRPKIKKKFRFLLKCKNNHTYAISLYCLLDEPMMTSLQESIPSIQDASEVGSHSFHSVIFIVSFSV